MKIHLTGGSDTRVIPARPGCDRPIVFTLTTLLLLIILLMVPGLARAEASLQDQTKTSGRTGQRSLTNVRN